MESRIVLAWLSGELRSNGSSLVRLLSTQFLNPNLGSTLNCYFSTVNSNSKPTWQLSAHAEMNRKRDYMLERVVERHKKLNRVSKIVDVLGRRPGKMMTLLSLARQRKRTGLFRQCEVVPLLTRFPAVFEVFGEDRNLMSVRLTEAAERLYDEELKLKADAAAPTVEKLRKLLMMAEDRRLTVAKIEQLKKVFGFPEDWKASIVSVYPQYFKVTETGEGLVLELTLWDSLLAVSFAEKRAAAQHSFDDVPALPEFAVNWEEIKRPSVSTLNLPEGLRLSTKVMARALKFQQLPYQSPYQSKDLDPDSVEAEKRACAVVHELLSLTLEKKILLDNLVHLRKDYKFFAVDRLRAMLIRHPELFYVSFKGTRESVFLRESYRGSELIEKNSLVSVKERFNRLVRQQGTKKEAALPQIEAEVYGGDDFPPQRVDIDREESEERETETSEDHETTRGNTHGSEEQAALSRSIFFSTGVFKSQEAEDSVKTVSRSQTISESLVLSGNSADLRSENTVKLPAWMQYCRYSYSEIPKAPIIGFREKPFSPFGPQDMVSRHWAGGVHLKKNKQESHLYSFNPPPSNNSGVGYANLGSRPQGHGLNEGKTREEIHGDPLTPEEVEELVEATNKSSSVVDLGRDGVTHNMVCEVFEFWKGKVCCRISCRGVPTVDMDNVIKTLEDKTGGLVISRVGGTLYLFRGRNYNHKTRGKIIGPRMLWKPCSPVYPKLIVPVPDGLTKDEARSLREKARKIPYLCRLSKNGVYLNLVEDVRAQFTVDELVKVNCSGLKPSDYKKIGAKLKELVPCVLLSFENEQIMMWRGNRLNQAAFP